MTVGTHENEIAHGLRYPLYLIHHKKYAHYTDIRAPTTNKRGRRVGLSAFSSGKIDATSMPWEFQALTCRARMSPTKLAHSSHAKLFCCVHLVF
eukprot:6212220-Pleurochrysis_carterae.AAC.2